MADAILDQKRWPHEDKPQLAHLLEFFEAATPQVYQTAQELVGIVRRHGYDSQEAIRKTLDECISLAFRSTGDDFDIERDLEEFRPGESMKDKYPDELPGCPIPLKLEIAKTLAINGISGPYQVRISTSDSGMAQITTVDACGTTRGPLAVNYQIMPPHQWFNFSDLPHHRRLVGEKIPGNYGRLPGEPGYNKANPPGDEPFSRTQPALVNERPVDQFGRLPGKPSYNTCFPLGRCPFDQINAVAGFETTQRQHMPGQPWHPTSMQHPALPLQGATRPHPNLFAPSLPNANRHNPMLPDTDLMRPYMAGVGLAVARTRLAQQIAINSGLDANAYQYAYNNPLSFIDPDGTVPQLSGASATPHKRKHPKPPATPPWNSPACNAVGTAALSALGACFDSSTAAIIAEIMQCLAYGESGCNPQEGSSSPWGPNGLFQLGCDQYNACKPSCCPPCTGDGGKTPGSGSAILQRGCNTQATVAFIHWLFDHFHGSSLGDILCEDFGTLPCPGTGRSSPQNEQAMKCLEAKGIDPFKIPRPNLLPTCPSCSKSPTH